MSTSKGAGFPPAPPAPGMEFAFELHAEVGTPARWARFRVGPVESFRFSVVRIPGPGLKGKILPAAQDTNSCNPGSRNWSPVMSCDRSRRK